MATQMKRGGLNTTEKIIQAMRQNGEDSHLTLDSSVNKRSAELDDAEYG